MKQRTVDPDRENNYKDLLKKEVLKRVGSVACRIFLYGSRVSGAVKRSSDFDIGIAGLSETEFFRLKARLEGIEDDLNIPHSVDIVNFEKVEASFADMVDLEGVEIWKQG